MDSKDARSYDNPNRASAREVVIHDYINLILLSLISAVDVYYLSITSTWSELGTAHMGDTFESHRVSRILSYMFLSYLAFDTVWIALFPSCVLPKPMEVIVHHIATIALASIPLYSKQFEWHSAAAMSVEISTIILIARRRLKKDSFLHRLSETAFYVLWVIYRLLLFPFFVVFFWLEYIRFSKMIGSYINPVIITSPLIGVVTIQGFIWTVALARNFMKKSSPKDS